MSSSPSSAAEFFRVGQRLTNYAGVDLTVVRTASGGFGAVAMGPNQRSGGQWRALKILRPDVLAGAGAEAQQRLQALFLREALTWRGLWPHPNLLTAHFVTEINSQLTLVLDYAEQGSLRDQFDAMRQRGSWVTISSALLLAQQIAAGLVALHTPDPDLLRPDPIIHRDLKPENILLDQYSYAMITDFGLAKAVALALDSSNPSNLSNPTLSGATPGVASGITLGGTPDLASIPDASPVPVNGQHTQAYHTRRGAALGTPAYMAPEQWIDASLADRPADAYAFGVILCELFTSRHPLLDLNRGYSQDAWRQAHLTGHPIPLRQLGATLFAAQREQAGMEWLEEMDTALVQLETLVARLLAKDAAARPSLTEALAALRAAAQALGEEPYTPPETYPHTTEHAMIFWQGWADAYDRFGLQAEALPRIEQAKALVPHDPGVLSSYGDILAGLGRMEEAEAAYRQALAALAAMPTDDRQIHWMVLNELGILLKDTGRFAEADEVYAAAVELLPDAANAWFNRAQNQGRWALAERAAGRYAEARAHAEQGLIIAERAVDLNPNDPAYPRQVQALRQLRDSL